MTTLSYASIKTASTAKENEEKRADAREKAMLLFAFQLLVDKGYIATATTFASECSLDLGQYIMCANIDLQMIFIEFEAYQNLKFERYPQYFRKSTTASTNGESLLSKLQKKGKQGSSSGARCSSGKPRRAQLEGEGSSQSMGEADPFSDMTPMVKSLHNQDALFNPQISVDGKLLKPISGLEFVSEDMRMFADMIQKEIIVQDLGVKWNDVVGLDNAKMVLMESLVYTKEFTDFFGNAFPPWRGLLLYGPPGNGKTLLAKAVANECSATFFNISSSSIVSKWRGDSEKIVKVLFELSRYHAPSIIFFDEFDALASCRDSGGESDASRRLKSELLQQMDGLLSQNSNGTGGPLVFVLAATNIPWDLDPAILRRLEKRMHVQLPNIGERKEIFQTYVRKAVESVSTNSRGRNVLVNNVNFDTAASITEGYSCSDLHQIVKECMVRKFRQQFSAKIKQLVIETNDIIATVESISPTVKSQLNQKYQSWDSQYGAT